jgi:CheY-like chemotaxis protein
MMTEVRQILLAEDNGNDVELTLAALRENKLINDVTVVSDGAEALDYLFRRGTFAGRPAGNPALILLDLKMPKVDGIEVLQQVKSDPHLKVIPVVMLTASREEQDLAKSYALGVNAYVVKPVDFQDFVAAVKLLGGFWAVVNQPLSSQRSEEIAPSSI